MTLFDRKFGKDFLLSIPTEPGVYSLYDEIGGLLYIGKAKNLRRRLSQYRKARRSKRGRKMRALVKETARIEWQICASELEAALEELRRIQALRPKRNIVGTFTFLYPVIGIWDAPSMPHFCFTTVPEKLPQFQFHGAFRSREIVAEGFFAWMRLLEFVGHRAPKKAIEVSEVPQYSYVFGFRRLPLDWPKQWSRFLSGESEQALEILALRLLENAGARAKAAEIQEALRSIDRFWEREVVPLRRVIELTEYSEYPVTAEQRDLLFVRAGFLSRGVSETQEVEK